MSLEPGTPRRVHMGNLPKPFAQMPALDGLKAFSVRIPETTALLVIENKGIFIGPPRGCQGQGFSVQFSAVHSRQVRQRSVGCRHRRTADFRVENLVTHKLLHRHGLGRLPCRESNHAIHTRRTLTRF